MARGDPKNFTQLSIEALIWYKTSYTFKLAIESPLKEGWNPRFPSLFESMNTGSTTSNCQIGGYDALEADGFIGIRFERLVEVTIDHVCWRMWEECGGARDSILSSSSHTSDHLGKQGLAVCMTTRHSIPRENSIDDPPITMTGENLPLITDEPVEVEK